MFKSIYEDIKSQFSYGNAVTRLIIINTAVLVAIYLVFVVIALSYGPGYVGVQNKFISYFTLPPSIIEIVKKPWTIISHMFLHRELFHFIFNMLVLFWFGRIFGDLMGDRRVIPLYILGGLMGVVFIMLGIYIFKIPAAPALGASAGIMAIVLASALIAPDYTLNLILLGPVRLKFIVLFMIVFDLIGLANMQNTGGHFGHIGGMFMGWLYILMVQSNRDPATWMNNAFDSIKNLFTKRPKKQKKSPLTVKHKATVPRSKKSNKKATMNVSSQDRLDAILDKIYKKGKDSLSKEEKDFLDKMSKQ